MSASPKRKVLIVDDHPLLREGLARVINREPDLVVCGEAGTAPTGLSAAVKSRPDVVIVDISLKEGSGLELIKDLHARYPKLPLLALSVHDESLYAERAVMAGARGYAMKHEPAERVVDALRKVLAGGMALGENILQKLVEGRQAGHDPASGSATDLLSDREMEVFRLFGEGFSTRTIASKLGISPSTVESYRVGIKQKLNLRNATELVAHAARFVATH